MTATLVILTVVEIVLVVVVLVVFLVKLSRLLSSVARTLGTIAFGVRAVETQVSKIGPSVTTLNEELRRAAAGLEEAVAAASDSS